MPGRDRWRVEIPKKLGNKLKDPKRIPKGVVDRALAAIRSLGDDPRPSGCTKLKGYEGLYRVRIGKNYRVVYRVFDREGKVLILDVGPKNEGTYKNW